MKQQGFTLIELMIVLVIITLLAAIAYPSYTSYVTRSKRAQAQAALLDMAARMERFYNANNTYSTATLASIGAPATTENGDYNLNIQAATGTAFNIQAVPQGAQATDDTACATLTYNQLGAKGITGTGTVADCW